MADWLCIAVALSVMAMTSGAAHARVKDYQILRLLSDKTDCNPERLESRPASAGMFVFHATCQNVTFYPDGLTIVCPDQDDERTCRIVGEKQTFKALDLLRQKE